MTQRKWFSVGENGDRKLKQDHRRRGSVMKKLKRGLLEGRLISHPNQGHKLPEKWL